MLDLRTILRKSQHSGWRFGVYYLILSFSLLALLPHSSGAAMVPTAVADSSAERTQDLAKVRAVLEHKLVAQRLADFGLTSQEISLRLDQLSDSQLHQIALQSDKIQPGGDPLGFGLIGLLIVAILVLLILHLTGVIDLTRLQGKHKNPPPAQSKPKKNP